MRVSGRRLPMFGATMFVATVVSIASVSAGRRSLPPDVVPGSVAQAALADLGAPSTPQALPGSDLVATGRYRFAAGCAAVVAAYQQPDAPVPEGTTVTVTSDGGLRFEAPFGPAAVFTRDDQDGGCTYEIRTTPTLVVSAPGVPAIAGFFTVSCFQPLGIAFVAVAQVDVDGSPHTVGIVQSEPVTSPPQPQPVQVGWYVGLPGDVLGAGSNQPGAVVLTGLSSTVDSSAGTGTVTGTSESGPVDVSFQCTVGNLTMPGF